MGSRNPEVGTQTTEVAIQKYTLGAFFLFSSPLGLNLSLIWEDTILLLRPKNWSVTILTVTWPQSWKLEVRRLRSRTQWRIYDSGCFLFLSKSEIMTSPSLLYPASRGPSIFQNKSGRSKGVPSQGITSIVKGHLRVSQLPWFYSTRHYLSLLRLMYTLREICILFINSTIWRHDDVGLRHCVNQVIPRSWK